MGNEVQVQRSPFDTQYTVNTWFIASVDYDLLDEVSLGLGYYNLANEIGPDGQRRGIVGKDNIWWSPDARVFFDITANIDKLYDLASGKKKASGEKKAAAQPHPLRTPAGIQQNM